MVQGYYGAVAKELRRLGFRYISNAKGSHEKWVNDAGVTLIVPRNLMVRHTANGILKDAGSELHL
ncbi:MAG: type II toxin-antitoxin system HicA family toxin [Devosia sp.]|uniref:type II toxin-antitoxin system HicA family toxin n=1 Tax=Devosia sp. TaxID=1871048 RepID=UPI001ACF7938|nr:type II toxin-antitoxin system HicA family toxin [Devosia sp.]MBN9317365.1 type II toxin-antitoxin system HicA family toxin [Devosia sp.]